MQDKAAGGVKLGHDAHLHISYSAGLQALQLGRFATALRCFQVVRLLHPSAELPQQQIAHRRSVLLLLIPLQKLQCITLYST